MPPSSGNVVNVPRMTVDTARVSRMRYSGDSFIAGSDTSRPTMPARPTPTSMAGTKFHPRVSVR